MAGVVVGVYRSLKCFGIYHVCMLLGTAGFVHMMSYLIHRLNDCFAKQLYLQTPPIGKPMHKKNACENKFSLIFLAHMHFLLYLCPNFQFKTF